MAEQIGLEGVFSLNDWSKNVGRYQSDLKRTISETNKASGSFSKSWSQMGATVGKTTAIMAGALVAAGAAAGSAIAGFAVGGIKQAMDLEAQMSNIAATLNTTAEAIAPLKQLIMDLALDPNLSVSATEAAIAVENLSRNGLTMQQILDGAAHSTVLLANATGADFGTAADIATDTMSIFNVSAENMSTAIDGIVSVTNASKFTIDDYRLALAQAGAVAAGAGVSMEDFNTVIAGTASRFASGSDGGTSFKTTLQRLIPQSKEATEMMKQLGLITEDGSNKFFDASGNMVSMNEASILLNQALGHLTEEQRLNALTVIAGADASRTMLGLIDLGEVAYTNAAAAANDLGVSQEELNKVIEGGITQFEALQIVQRQTDAVQQAEERNRNFAAALKILKDTIGGVQLAIGDQFLPMLTEMARGLNDLIKENSPAIIAFFTSLRDWLQTAIPQAIEGFKGTWATLSTAFTTVRDAVIPVATALGDIASTLIDNLGPILLSINPNMDALKGALAGIAAVLAAATITAGITAMAGALATLLTPIGLVILAAAGLGAIWNTNWLGMRDKTIAIVDEIKAAFTPLTEAITQFGSGALTEIQAFVTGNETEFTNLKAIWDGAKESFTNVSTGIQEAATGFVTYLKEQFPQLTPVIDGFATAVELLVSQVQAQWTLLQEATTAFVGVITSLISGDWAGAWQSAQDLAGAFVTYVETSFANVKTTFEETFGAINPVVTGALTEIQNFVTGNKTEFTNLKTIWDDAKTSFDEAFSGISTWFTTNWPGIKATLEKWGVDFGKIEEAIGTLQEAWDTFSTEFSTAIDTVKTAWNTLVDLFGPSIDRLIESFQTFATEVQGLGDEFDGLMDALGKLGEAFSDVWNVIRPILSQIAIAIGVAFGAVSILAINLLASTFENLGDIIETVINQATLIIDTFATVIDSLVTGAKAAIDGDWATAWESLKTLGQAAINLLTGSIENLGTLLGTIGTTVKDAITNTLDDLGILEPVQNFVRNIADTLTNFINWEFVGSNIMTFFRNGISSMLSAITTKAGEIASGASEILTSAVDWLQRGKDIIAGVISGLQAILNLGTGEGSLAGKAIELATSAADAFVNFDWLATGKAIIDGIMEGLSQNGSAIVDYLTGLGTQALDAIKALFGIESPSKVMMQIGRDIIEGWLIGMRSNERRLYAAIQGISDGIARIAGRAGENAIEAYRSAFQSFSTVAGGKQDPLDLLDILESPELSPVPINPQATQRAINLIKEERRTFAFLRQQSELIEAIRKAGGDPEKMLAGITLGPNANPVRLAEIVGLTMTNLNQSLLISMQNAASGLDREIEDARARREDIAAIEERFQEQTFDARSNYARRLASIDEQIAQAEEDAIRTGNRNVLLRIQSLDHQRDAIVKEFEMLITHQRQLEGILTRQPVSDNQRGQAAIERWRQTMIDPLLNGFEHLAAGVRAARLQDIDRHMRLIQGFAAQLPMIAGAEARLMQALEGFGTGARNRAEQLLNLVYDPRMASVAASRAQAVHDFANSLNSLRSELARLSGQRLTGETIIERMMGGFDQMTAYQNALEAVDRQIAGMEAHIMETGNVNSLNTIRAMDATRAQRQADIENFVRQTQALESIMRQVKNFSGPGQASAERFFQEQIQTIADAFSSPMRSVDRDAWIQTARTRVEMINRFVEQMRQLERVQNRVAGNQNFAHLADEFAQLQDILMPETTRGSLINQLNSYITQMMRLHEIQQDISAGRGVNPLVERFASERLDAVARQLENINLTEAERNRLIEQYRIEQEKILAIQQKQQQLDFINQQLALINQLRSLDDEEGWSVNVESILSGIGLGMNASIDDLMRLTSRVLDELVRFANHELGIASPSKVFAKVGMNLMAGLESGIMAGMRQPMNALRSAAGNLVPYSLSQRALNINMGGVTINDGMDAVMFEAKMRQIVRSEFAA